MYTQWNWSQVLFFFSFFPSARNKIYRPTGGSSTSTERKQRGLRGGTDKTLKEELFSGQACLFLTPPGQEVNVACYQAYNESPRDVVRCHNVRRTKPLPRPCVSIPELISLVFVNNINDLHSRKEEEHGDKRYKYKLSFESIWNAVCVSINPLLSALVTSSRTITSDRTVYNNLSLSFWTRRYDVTG